MEQPVCNSTFRRTLGSTMGIGAIAQYCFIRGCGYYDLAHMASDFRDICGYSPSELIHQGQELTEAFGQKFSGLMKKKIKIENLI